MSFAVTISTGCSVRSVRRAGRALAQLGKRYYGGGRTMSTDTLKQTFDQLMTPAKELQAKYLPQIQEKARNVNMGDVMAMIKR